MQTICMELPLALAFLNFLSVPLENSVTGRLCRQMLQVTVSSIWSLFEVTSVAAALELRLEASSPLAFLFGTFDIVQVVQTIGMELPFALAFLNFLSLPLENSVTGRLCRQILQVSV